jgi:rhodanese-related sulfurtransferase
MSAEPPQQSVDGLLERARAQLARMTPAEALNAVERGDLIVDIRPVEQRRRDGAIPGAYVVSRNVLEWRLDPGCEHRDPMLARTDCRVIVLCDEGFQSSLAAATLRQFGLDATDVIGGAQEWRRLGLPMARENGG